jgi:hypothetical protein
MFVADLLFDTVNIRYIYLFPSMEWRLFKFQFCGNSKSYSEGQRILLSINIISTGTIYIHNGLYLSEALRY